MMQKQKQIKINCFVRIVHMSWSGNALPGTSGQYFRIKSPQTVGLKLGGLGLQQLRVGLGSQPEIGLGCGGESPRSQPVDQWSMTRALALPLCRKKFPQRWEVVKQVKYLLGQRVQHMWIDILADSEGESLSCAHMAV